MAHDKVFLMPNIPADHGCYYNGPHGGETWIVKSPHNGSHWFSCHNHYESHIGNTYRARYLKIPIRPLKISIRGGE